MEHAEVLRLSMSDIKGDGILVICVMSSVGFSDLFSALIKEGREFVPILQICALV